MKKTVYSLVLSSEVVSMVDQAAYQNNTSRSNLINQILAEYVSYTTPEKRLEEIYSHCMKVFEAQEHFQVQKTSSDYIISIRSPLPYKYNPAIKYSIELYPKDNEDGHGEFRVSIRSSNDGLLNQLKKFFQLWVKVELAYGINRKADIAEGRFTRVIQMPDNALSDAQVQGETLADYICALDNSMKDYFMNKSDMVTAVRRLERHYIEFLKKHNEAV